MGGTIVYGHAGNLIAAWGTREHWLGKPPATKVDEDPACANVHTSRGNEPRNPEDIDGTIPVCDDTCDDTNAQKEVTLNG